MQERRWPARVALLLAIVVGGLAVVAQDPPPAEPIDAPTLVFSAGRSMKHVDAIAVEPHPTASLAIGRVREYLVGELKKLGLQPEIEVPVAPHRAERNLFARIKGTGLDTKKGLLLCAHYDSTPNGPGAGDDASGVAVVLETIRALKAGPSLDRDVMILLDDGEELGMLGAETFVDGSPWAKHVGVVLNFDARGHRGPSIMFETSPKNGWLIRQFAAASPHPVAASLSMDLYRIMPNDTDLTIFNRAGLSGLNFAFSRGAALYHSKDDTPGNLDPRTLQHQGENALAMARRLGGLDLDDTTDEDAIYFSVLNRFVLSYPQDLAPMLAILPTALWAAVALIGLIKRRLSFGGMALGLVAWPFAAVASIIASGGFWLVVADIFGNLGIPPVSFELPILLCCSAVATMVTIGVYRSAARSASVESLAMGALAWWAGLAGATALYLPGSSYLFTWPAVFVLLGLDLGILFKRGSVLGTSAIFLGALPLLVMLPPLTRDGFEGVGLRLAGPLMIMVVLLLGAGLPLLRPLIDPRRIPAATPRPRLSPVTDQGSRARPTLDPTPIDIDP